MNSPRAQAAEILSFFDPLRQDIAETFKQPRYANNPAVRDYVLGVLKNREAIDAVLKAVSKINLRKTEKLVLSSLRIAVYELIYKPLTPEYAIINEAVSLFSKKAKKNFANAVLRNIQRHIACRCCEYSADSRIIPVGDKACRFDMPVASDPSEYVEYLSGVFSLPDWLVMGWQENWGSDRLFDLCRASNRTPTTYLRPNTTLITPEKLLCLLLESQAQVELTEEGLIVLKSFGKAKNVFSLPGYEEGFFSVQDKTAFKVGNIINPGKDNIILDLCAAPGSKTTHIAELCKRTGKIIATDINAERLKMVRQNASRLKLANIEVVDYPEAFNYALKQPRIDAVLIDAPCSNTGVLAKRIERRYRITPQSIDSLADIGFEIACKSLNRLKSCQTLFYSTCSIEKKENAQVLHRLSAQFSDISLIMSETTLPSVLNYGCDGGYIAKAARKNHF